VFSATDPYGRILGFLDRDFGYIKKLIFYALKFRQMFAISAMDRSAAIRRDW
jgi:hypothetical protein